VLPPLIDDAVFYCLSSQNGVRGHHVHSSMPENLKPLGIKWSGIALDQFRGKVDELRIVFDVLQVSKILV
jgi:hypothetical protein